MNPFERPRRPSGQGSPSRGLGSGSRSSSPSSPHTSHTPRGVGSPHAPHSNHGGGRNDAGRGDGRGSAGRRSFGGRSLRRLPPHKAPRETYEPSALQGPDLEREREPKIPPVPDNAIRIVPLGGVEEVGRNMTVVETPEDIFILDMGFQFMSETDTPGIDYILPNVRYLEDRKDKIRAVIITHGHLDHIGAIPYVMPRIGNPPIYTRNLTSVMIKKRQDEFPHLAPLDIKILEPNEHITIATMPISTFPVTHSIPDAMGVILETKYGNIVFTGDLKLDHKDGVPTDVEQERWSKVGKGNNLLFVADSTNTERPGWSITESAVHLTLEEIIKNAQNRLIIGTFASQFERMIKIIEICDKYNKKIITEGRSIRTNIEIAELTGILKIKKGTIIPIEEMGDYPPDKIVILATGAQGEEFAALMRIGTKKHKHIMLNERDIVVLSSSVIPGNEVSVQRLKDNLYRHGVRIINYRVSDVHSTGHGNAGELVWINKKVGAKFFMPAYGFHSMLRNHAQANIDAGFPKENVIIPDNGTVIDILDGERLHIHKDKAPSIMMMVDGFSIGDMQEVVIRDRQTLAKDGIVTVLAIVNPKTGRLRKSPDIISRGFVYIRESQELFQQVRGIVKKSVEESTRGLNPINPDYAKNALADNVARFLFQKTNKRPIVIPVLIAI